MILEWWTPMKLDRGVGRVIPPPAAGSPGREGVDRGEIGEAPRAEEPASCRAERELETSRRLYHSLVEHVPYTIFRKDLDGRYTFGNRRYCDLHGTDLEGLIGKTDFDLYPADLACKYRDDDRRTIESREPLDIEEEHLDPRLPGGRRFVHTIKCPTYDADGRPSGIQGMFADITERRLSHERLEFQATHDPLTGLANRDLFCRRLDEAIRAAEAGRQTLAVMLIDLDQFKEINDTFGHHCGDHVLQCVGRRFGSSMRPGDTLARLGGDEFGVVLPGCKPDHAARIAGRLIRCLHGPIDLDRHRFGVGASIGIAIYPEHGADGVTLLRHADIAMYAAKRGQVGPTFFAPGQSNATPGKLALGTDLRDAVGTDQFVLHYQPKIDLLTGRPCGAEALMRWQHPRLGLIAPGQFIPMAEQMGYIAKLDLWAIVAVLKDAGDLGWAGEACKIAVNLSASSLQDARIVDRIIEIVETAGQPPERLQIEVTESAMMTNPGQARASLYRLHEMGMTVAIDDFGTGYSSLAYLKNLPVDEVKIDQSFVREMASLDSDACIVRAVVDLGHNLGLRVTAEGVEDAATLAILSELGCDFVQGYHLGRPVGTGEFRSWLASKPSFPARRESGRGAATSHVVRRRHSPSRADAGAGGRSRV
ncbi:putative bifunctional diguanylate cyclase/phosphodiesterase [Tundrisphaera sp. TA3]|uniref:putative bifunctional diguanylate cyclase/phosphodiesterase n=1 Tax=Tundrisphaera sp. TA3 TaxID=3435775 RepID=UPI003EB76ABC